MVCALKRIAVEVHNVAVHDHDLMWTSSLSGPDYTTCRNTPCVPQVQHCFSCAYNDLQLQLQLIRLLNTVVSELILCVQSPIKYYSPSDEVGAVNAVAVKSQGNLCSPQVRGQQWHWGRVVWRGAVHAHAQSDWLVHAHGWMEAYCEPLEHEKAFLHKATNQQHIQLHLSMCFQSWPTKYSWHSIQAHFPNLHINTLTHRHLYIHTYTISGTNVSQDISSKGHTVEDWIKA